MASTGVILLFGLTVITGVVGLGGEDSNIEFQLYTKKNPTNGSRLLPDASNLRDTDFDASKKSVIILHGFTENYESRNAVFIRDGHLETTDSNVIVVNWWPMSRGPHYQRAAQNTNHVAEKLSVFLDSLIYQSERHLVHCIGVGLGAQILGIAAQKIKYGPLVRITALDPAKPLFDIKDDAERLDIGDAEFVEVIHSSGGFLSFSESIGHADFYPNGGKSPQPRCFGECEGSMSCSHHMACIYYSESLYSPMAFPATLCDSWSRYKNGKCSNNEQVLMGASTPTSARGSFYLKTNAVSPYGQGTGKDMEEDNIIGVIGSEDIGKMSTKKYFGFTRSIMNEQKETDPNDVLIMRIFLEFFAILVAVAMLIAAFGIPRMNRNTRTR